MLNEANLKAFLNRETAAHDSRYYQLKVQPARGRLLKMRFEEVPVAYMRSASIIFLHSVDEEGFLFQIQHACSRERTKLDLVALDQFLNLLLCLK